jgi:2,3-bisphosphoglycerate-independent phosphoglycerate mutase
MLREGVQLTGVELFVETVKEHRFLVVFRGDDLGGEINDTDPQTTGVLPLAPEPVNDASRKTAAVVQKFINQAGAILSGEEAANMLTLRGFAKHRPYASMMERYSLRSLCLANYPMYRGVALLAGMEMHPITPSMPAALDALEQNYSEYDFFFVHAKTTDKTGEDGDFRAKVAAIEELDSLIPRFLKLNPYFLFITYYHSTPSALSNHSWHPVPVLLASQFSRLDLADRFTELECLKGALGQVPSKDLMALALAHAGRLKKFGA